MLYIHISRPLSEAQQLYLQTYRHPDSILTYGDDLPEQIDILVDGRPTEQLLNHPGIKRLIIPWAGLPVETAELLQQFPQIAVHNLHHNSVPVSEMVVALLLSTAKRIIIGDQGLRQLDWRSRYESEPMVTLKGRTALILGYGHIGKLVAQSCLGLGMHLLATRASIKEKEIDGSITVFPASQLHTLLPQANAILICLPLTDETRDLIGAKELAMLPQPAVLVNVGRAAIVNEVALYNALSSGQLFGAGLDVWYNYPKDKEGRVGTPPSAYPFHTLPNVVLSPHRAGSFGVAYTEEARVKELAILFNEIATGDTVRNQIDINRGY